MLSLYQRYRSTGIWTRNGSVYFKTQVFNNCRSVVNKPAGENTRKKKENTEEKKSTEKKKE